MTGAEMVKRILTVALVVLMSLSACAYDRDPATPDEFATPGFKESVADYRAAQDNEPALTLPDGALECLTGELASMIESGDLSQDDVALWLRGTEISGPAADAVQQLVDDGVC